MLKITIRKPTKPILNEELLTEVSAEDVITTLNSKKYSKKIAHAISISPEMQKVLAVGEINMKEAYPPEKYGDEYKIAALQGLIAHAKELAESHIRISVMRHRDITPAQSGAGANWLKNIFVVKSEHVDDPLYMYLFQNTRRGATLASEAGLVGQLIEKFFQFQDFIPEQMSKDLGSYHSTEELHDVVDAAEPLYRAHQEKKDYLDAEQGSDLVYDGPEWSIYIPRNKGAACQLGKGTDWCTAAPGLDYYEEYHKENDPLFIFVNKKNPKEKYQFHYGTSQFMDIHDHRINGTETFTKLHKLLVNNVDNLPSTLTENIKIDDNDIVTTKSEEGDEGGTYYYLNWNVMSDDIVEHNADGPARISLSNWVPTDRDIRSGIGTNDRRTDGTNTIEGSWSFLGKSVAMIITDRSSDVRNSVNISFFLDIANGGHGPVFDDKITVPKNFDAFEFWKELPNTEYGKVFLSKANALLEREAKQYAANKEPEELSESLLTEISTEDVLQTLLSKKARKKIIHILSQPGQLLDFSDRETRNKSYGELSPEGQKEYQQELTDMSVENVIMIMAILIKSAIPDDITDAQKGVAANWLKSMLFVASSSDIVIMARRGKSIQGSRNTLYEFHVYTLKHRIENFFKFQDFMPQPFSKDLMSYDTYEQLQNAVNEARPLYQAHQEKKAYLDAEQGMDVLYDGEDWKIVIPRNKGAACEIGKGTSWCTAAPGLDYYEQYHKEDDPLIVFIDKKNPENRYQLHFGTDQYMDRNDSPIGEDRIAEFIKFMIKNIPQDSLPPVLKDNAPGQRYEIDKYDNLITTYEHITDYSYAVTKYSTNGLTSVDGPAKITLSLTRLPSDERIISSLVWSYMDKQVAAAFDEGDGFLSFSSSVPGLHKRIQLPDRRRIGSIRASDWLGMVTSSKEWQENSDLILFELDRVARQFQEEDKPESIEEHKKAIIIKLGKSLLNEKLLNEISREDVLQTLRNGGTKKIRKKILNTLKQNGHALFADDANVYQKQRAEEVLPAVVNKLKEFTAGATPKDLESSQQGAVANWVKNYVASNPSMLNGFIKDVLEDMPAADFTRRVWSSIFERFFQMQDFIPTEFFSRDLNQYKSIGEVEAATTAALPLYRAHQEKKDYLDAEQGSDLIYDGPEWSIFIPRNKGAACELGKGTSWCTAAPGLDYYEQYHKEDDPLFVFVNKKNPEEKYQFHYGTQSFMDADDESVNSEIFVKLHKLLVNNVDNLPSTLTENIKIDDNDNMSKKSEKGDGKTDYYLNWTTFRTIGDSVTHNADGPAFVHLTSFHQYNIESLKAQHFSQVDAKWVYLGKTVATIKALNRPPAEGSSGSVDISFFLDMADGSRRPALDLDNKITVTRNFNALDFWKELPNTEYGKAFLSIANTLLKREAEQDAANKDKKQLQMKEHKKSLKFVIGAKRQ